MPTALAAGAAAVVIQDGADAPNAPYARVADARSALAAIAAEFYEHPSRELRLFAVTGTDGKTTTTYLLEQIFASRGLATGLIGTVEVKIGTQSVPNIDRMTTPESLDVQRTLRSMVTAGVTHAAIEASSHALALGRLDACEFAACALTNITGDHVEFHGSDGAYFDAKASLFTRLGSGRPAILNADDAGAQRVGTLLPSPPFWYGKSGNADLKATKIQTGSTSTACEFVYRDRSCALTVPLGGSFNVNNALAAAGLALSAGIDLPDIATGISSARVPAGRMQRVDSGQDFAVVVDYAHTVNAFRTVLRSLKQQQGDTGRLIAVFGAAGNRDRAKRPVLAQIARENTDFFYITNEDPFGEDAGDIIAEISEGLPSAELGERYETIPDRTDAIAAALARAQPGDTVVILGKGHEQSIVTNGRKQAWSDVEVVLRLLEGRA